MGNFWEEDESYRKEIEHYKKRDALFAGLLYLVNLLVFFAAGYVHANYNRYLGNELSILLIVCSVVLVLARKQKLSSVGISSKKLGKSVLLGAVPGCIILIANGVTGIINHTVLPSTSYIAMRFFYYFIIIAFTEELIFRGYIQTRIQGLIHNQRRAIGVTAILFMGMHIPYQASVAGTDLITFLASNWIMLLMTGVWHVVFQLLYRKYNNITAPVIMHALMDWSSDIFT